MDNKLVGRRIVVTGAASGIGKAIAELFCRHGASLALLDRKWSEGSPVPHSAKAFECDVTDREAVARTMERSVEFLGGIDGLINAAGVLDISSIDELSAESWDRMLMVNVTGPFNIVKAALPYLRKEAVGTIVTIGSVSGLMPMAGTSGYSASKAAAHMFTKCLAFDLAPSIRANTICPGTIRTEMTRYIFEQAEHLARAESRTALKRVGEPIEIARAALFLSCEDSGFTTGTELPVDGGFSWR